MIGTILRTGCLAIAAGGLLATSGSAQNIAAPDAFQLEIHANFIQQSGEWVSSGAFSDEGTILSVSSFVPAGTTTSLVETLQGNQGTFTLDIRKLRTPVPGQIESPMVLDSGAWRITGGTGAYANMTGAGTIEGTVNFETGDVFDTFEGHVNLNPPG